MNIDFIEKLKEYPIIDKNILMKNFGYKKEYAYLVLQRLKKRSILTQLAKGKYTAIDDVYKIFSNFYYPSYIGFLTASMLKKSTEQIINTVQVASNYNKSFKFRGYTIEFIKIKRNFFFGYVNQDGVFIADDEKLLLDMLLYRNYSGNFNEVIKVVKNFNLNKEKLIKYLKKISSKSLIKRVGFLVEMYKNIDISQKFKLDNNYIYLDSLDKSYTKTNSKWRVKHD